MIREKIEGSSNILELGFELSCNDEAQTGTMEVRFKNGLYSYAGVDLEAYERIRGAKSVGGEFALWLKSPAGKVAECTPFDMARCEACDWAGKMKALRVEEGGVTHCPTCDSTMILEDQPR